MAERFGSSFDAFVEIMGIKDEAAWKAIQEAYDRHATSLRGE